MAAPIPREPPVTSAVLLSSFFDMLNPSGVREKELTARSEFRAAVDTQSVAVDQVLRSECSHFLMVPPTFRTRAPMF
jgi:hypothetical protein